MHPRGRQEGFDIDDGARPTRALFRQEDIRSRGHAREVSDASITDPVDNDDDALQALRAGGMELPDTIHDRVLALAEAGDAHAEAGRRDEAVRAYRFTPTRNGSSS